MKCHIDLRPTTSCNQVPLQACSLQALARSQFTEATAVLTEDGSLACIHKGPTLEVVNVGSGVRVASLSADLLTEDVFATVVCVREFSCSDRLQLLVAINCSNDVGIVALLDTAISMVVKAIEIPCKITTLEGVWPHADGQVRHWAFSHLIQQFCGIVAVGTVGGCIYLIDMKLDTDTMFSDRYDLSGRCPLQIVNAASKDHNSVRKEASLSGKHLAVCLSDEYEMSDGDCFHFRQPDGAVVCSLSSDEVCVSCVKYFPHTGTLAVGYSFGAFHLWSLSQPVLQFTSAYEPGNLPVASFIYHEPENDPKNFVYVWVCNDAVDSASDSRGSRRQSVCGAALYQLGYVSRRHIVGHGAFHEGLCSVSLRLDICLTADPLDYRDDHTCSSRLLSAAGIVDPNRHSTASPVMNDSFEEALGSRAGKDTGVFLGIFDINRWYHAQMPDRLKCVKVGGQEVCPFFAVYRMDDVACGEGCGALLNISILSGTVQRFLTIRPSPPEQHFYPSSLAFDILCIFSTGAVVASALGVQRQVLSSMDDSGPVCLLRPLALYSSCVRAGLLQHTAETSASDGDVEEHQRMSILTLALEHDKIGFLMACMRSWSDGEFQQQGYSLKALLMWAWTRVSCLKEQIDRVALPFFDQSGAVVDWRLTQVLSNSLCSLGHLNTVLIRMLHHSAPISLQGQADLDDRIQVVSLLHRHLKVMLWFVHNGLLPEHDECLKPTPPRYAYPALELTQIYLNRRLQITQHDKEVLSRQVILIDALVFSAGPSLRQLWQSKRGSGDYPPPSLHAALSVYLLDGVDPDKKNAIMLYLLFDMAAVGHCHHEQFAEKIPLFARMFDVPVGVVQQVHGFWLIDHMNFEDGLNQLSRQGTCPDLGLWQHDCVLRSILLRNEAALAMRYVAIRDPPVLTAEDRRTRLTVLVANRFVWQAIGVVRSTCGSIDTQAMMSHIFAQCRKWFIGRAVNAMDVLFDQPLLPDEEDCLHNHLAENSGGGASPELLVLHLLQRAQYASAIRFNDQLRNRATMDRSSKAIGRSKTINTIVDGYRNSLSSLQRYLLSIQHRPDKLPVRRKVEVSRPKPLSTVVTGRWEKKARCQSSMVLAIMDTVAEARKLLTMSSGNIDDGDGSLKVRASSDRGAWDDIGAFLSTPTTPRVQSRLTGCDNIVYPFVRDVTPVTSLLQRVASPGSARQLPSFSEDCMSLLLTPNVEPSVRVVSPVLRSAACHSILKMSGMVPSAIESGGGEPTVPYAACLARSNAMSPESIPTSGHPAAVAAAHTVQPVTTEIMPLNEVVFPAAADAATPKQIRFGDPQTYVISPYNSPDSLTWPGIQCHHRESSYQPPGTTPSPVAMTLDGAPVANDCRSSDLNGKMKEVTDVCLDTPTGIIVGSDVGRADERLAVAVPVTPDIANRSSLALDHSDGMLSTSRLFLRHVPFGVPCTNDLWRESQVTEEISLIASQPENAERSLRVDNVDHTTQDSGDHENVGFVDAGVAQIKTSDVDVSGACADVDDTSMDCFVPDVSLIQVTCLSPTPEKRRRVRTLHKLRLSLDVDSSFGADDGDTKSTDDVSVVVEEPSYLRALPSVTTMQASADQPEPDRDTSHGGSENDWQDFHFTSVRRYANCEAHSKINESFTFLPRTSHSEPEDHPAVLLSKRQMASTMQDSAALPVNPSLCVLPLSDNLPVVQCSSEQPTHEVTCDPNQSHFTLPAFERDVQPAVPDSLGSGVHAPASEVLSSSTVPQTVQLGLEPEHHLRSQECQLPISGFQLSTPFLTSSTCTLSSASTSTAITTPSTYSLMLPVKGVDGRESLTSPDPSIGEVYYGAKSDSRGPVTMTRAGRPPADSMATERASTTNDTIPITATLCPSGPDAVMVSSSDYLRMSVEATIKPLCSPVRRSARLRTPERISFQADLKSSQVSRNLMGVWSNSEGVENLPGPIEAISSTNMLCSITASTANVLSEIDASVVFSHGQRDFGVPIPVEPDGSKTIETCQVGELQERSPRQISDHHKPFEPSSPSRRRKSLEPSSPSRRSSRLAFKQLASPRKPLRGEGCSVATVTSQTWHTSNASGQHHQPSIAGTDDNTMPSIAGTAASTMPSPHRTALGVSTAGGGHSGRICAARGNGGDPETAAKLTASEMRVVTKATIGEVGQAALFPSTSDVVLTWNCDPTDELSGLPASSVPSAVSASFSDVDLHRPCGRASKTKRLLPDVTDIHSIARVTEEVRLHKKMRRTPDGCTCETVTSMDKKVPHYREDLAKRKKKKHTNKSGIPRWAMGVSPLDDCVKLISPGDTATDVTPVRRSSQLSARKLLAAAKSTRTRVLRQRIIKMW